MHNTPAIHILMTGAGAPGAPGIIHCLLQDKNIQLTVADADDEAIGKYLHHSFVKIKKATEPDFVASVLQVCKQKKINLVLPLVTRELLPLAENRELFTQAGVGLMLSSAQAITIANNKVSCYRFLAVKGLQLPAFFVSDTVESFADAALKLGYPKNPFCFKPAVANGSRGFRIVSDTTDAADELFLKKPYNTFIQYTDVIKILSARPFPQLLVSEYLPGMEYSVDCLANHGEAILILPRSREKMINGISVKGRFVKDERIINYCRQIIELIGLHGNIGIQLKCNAEGIPLLLEINPRVQGTIVSAMGAGINFPLLAVRQQLGITLTEDETTVKWNTSFSRYWTEVYY